MFSYSFAEEAEKVAIKAAEEWLTLVDEKNYKKSWEEASKLFKKSIRDQRPISPCTTCCIYNGIDTKSSALHTRQRNSKLLSIYYSLTGGTYASNYGETGSRVIR